VTLHIIVPVHNRAAVSERFAAAIGRQTLREFRLLLVDDGCTDDTVERVRAQVGDQRLLVLNGDGNLWWAGSLQMAYDHLLTEMIGAADAVLIINDDVGFDDDFLEQGLAVLATNRDACIQAIGIDRTSGTIDCSHLITEWSNATDCKPVAKLTQSLINRNIFDESLNFNSGTPNHGGTTNPVAPTAPANPKVDAPAGGGGTIF